MHGSLLHHCWCSWHHRVWLSSIDKLCNFINGLAEAKEVVQDIASSLEAVQLAALEELKISDSATYAAAKEDLEKTGVPEAVNKMWPGMRRLYKEARAVDQALQ